MSALVASGGLSNSIFFKLILLLELCLGEKKTDKSLHSTTQTI
jgi:hypothetical protein